MLILIKRSMIRKSERGAPLVEYALVIALVALAAILVLTALGGTTSSLYGGISSSLNGLGLSAPALQTVLASIDDWQARELAYYQQHGSWPRTWSPYNFTDIGLNPADWTQAIDGLILSPHGDEVGLTPAPGYHVYVQDLNGNTEQLYSGWAIWCPVNDSNCYYHTVAPGNEVNIHTITVTSP